jgi:transposase
LGGTASQRRWCPITVCNLRHDPLAKLGTLPANRVCWQAMKRNPRQTPTSPAYGPPSVEKALGSLPVVASYCRRLKIAERVDALCPMRDVSTSTLTHGQVVELAIANRLTSPAPLVHMQDWAGRWAVGEVFGVPPESLNDDRISRALDALAGSLDTVTGSVGLAAIDEFGLDATRAYWDMTSMSVYGSYDNAEEGLPTPKYGHPKDRRPDLKQVQAGLGVCDDGAVPVFHRCYDGGAGEVSQVVPAMKAMQELAGPARVLVIGDSKLLSYDNVAAMCGDGVDFIAPASKTYVSADTLAAQRLDDTTEVGYVAARDAHKHRDDRGRWFVREDTAEMTGRKKDDPPVGVRRVFVHSTARAAAMRASREKKLERARQDLGRVVRSLGSKHYPDERAVTDRVQAISGSRKVRAYLRTLVGTDPETGKPTLSWWFYQDAVDAEAAADGWYALLTSLDKDKASAAEVLLRFKGKEAVERRIQAFKGPLAVAPMFLKNNKRIAALVTIVCLALLIFCLVEREVRKAAGQGKKINGLYAGRPAVPTGRLVFQALSGLRLLPGDRGDPWVVPRPSAVAVHLLELLQVDPRQPRYG